MRNENEIKNAEKILEEDLKKKSNEYLMTKKSYEGGLSLSLLISLASIILLFLIGAFVGLEGSYFSARVIVLYSVLLVAVYFTVNSFILAVRNFITTNTLTNFWNFAFSKNSSIICIFLTISVYLGISQIIILSNQEIIKTKLEGNIFDSLISDFLNNFFSSALVVTIGILFIILCKRLILQMLTWRIHHQSYRDRILENEKIIKHLLSLNNAVTGPMDSDLLIWSTRLYTALKASEEGLTIDDFKRLFSREGKNLFRLFDTNSDGIISEEEFVKRYVSIFKERQQLIRSIDSHALEMKKLDAILNLIAFPLVLYIALSAIGHGASVSKFFFSAMGVVLPLSFIFGPMVAEIFWSLIFIFLVRPYDLGDEIIIDGVHYSVGEMGLLYSIFFADGKYHSFSNAVLRSKVIINLRRTRAISAEFLQKVSYETGKDKMDELKNRISSFLSANPQVYSQKFSISDFLIYGDTFEFSIHILISCPYQEIDAAKKRKDEFAIFLHDTLCELGFQIK